MLDSLVSNQNSQIADKDIGKNKKHLNTLVHSLGLGKHSSVLGKSDIIKYGNEMPRPRSKKMPTEINTDG
ncbi:MAG: hypothetical protein ACR5K9_00530 [Wolbachia sp.]